MELTSPVPGMDTGPAGGGALSIILSVRSAPTALRFEDRVLPATRRREPKACLAAPMSPACHRSLLGSSRRLVAEAVAGPGWRQGPSALSPSCCHLLGGAGAAVANRTPLASLGLGARRPRHVLLQQIDRHGEQHDVL